VAGGEVDQLGVLHLGQLGDVGVALGHHLAQHVGGELAGDDGDRHVVAALVAEHLVVAGHAEGFGDGDAAEPLPQLVGQVDEVLVLEHRPVGQRHLAVDHGQLVVDDPAVPEGAGVDVDDPGDAVGPGIRDGVGDGPAPAVPDEHHGIGQRVDHVDHRVHVVPQPDAGPVGVPRFLARKRERLHVVARHSQRPRHVVPRSAIEPEPRDQDDVHAGGA
jgi:hypothetical protein